VVSIDDRLPEVLLSNSPRSARGWVMHRLRRIETVTGRKLADPRARLQWQLALLDTDHRRPA
jgi:hypothetical protein